MDEYNKERLQLDTILKERPGFFIRWGLVVFVVVICIVLIFIYYSGIISYFGGKN